MTDEIVRTFIAMLIGFVFGMCAPITIVVKRMHGPQDIAKELAKQYRGIGKSDHATILERLARGEDPDKVISEMPEKMRKDFEEWQKRNKKKPQARQIGFNTERSKHGQ